MTKQENIQKAVDNYSDDYSTDFSSANPLSISKLWHSNYSIDEQIVDAIIRGEVSTWIGRHLRLSYVTLVRKVKHGRHIIVGSFVIEYDRYSPSDRTTTWITRVSVTPLPKFDFGRLKGNRTWTFSDYK